MQIVETVPSAVSLALAKQHLKITHESENDLIGAYVASATRLVEAYSGVRLIRRELVARTLRWNASTRLPGPVVNVTSTVSRNSSGQEVGAEYWLPEGLILWDRQAVGPYEITYVAGMAESAEELRPDVRAAVLNAVGHLYIYREGQPFGEGLMAQIRTIKGLKF